ncbi:MAG TPA: hypothetical protein VGM81_01005 [Burkholderiaceae bacterium]|jgi:hypothetical protein
MAEKFLSDAEWKKFAKGRDLKDAPLIKAFEALEKAKKPADQVSALAEIEKQTDALRKFVKADRDFGAYLDGIDKAIAKEEKLAKAALQEAEKSESEDEEETPTLLTTKMVPLLRQVKAGDEAQVLIASTGKDVAVLLSRRSISPTKRKLLNDYLEVSGGVKYILGHCIFEEETYTFVVQSQASGLAKKLKAALLKQTELRLKVRVRGEDPNDVDEDGEAGEGEGEEAPQQTQTQTPAPTQGSIPPAPPLPPDALKLRFEKRWAELEPRVLSALKANAGDVSKIRAVSEFVREKGEGGAWQAGLQGMESLEKLLPAPAPRQDDAPLDQAAAFNVRLATYMEDAKPMMATSKYAQELKLKLSEAGMYGRKKEFEQGHEVLDLAEALIIKMFKERDGEEDESEESEEGEEGESESQEAQIRPTPQGQGANNGAGTGGKSVSQVAFTQARLDWNKTRKQVQAELKKLVNDILASSTDEDDFDQIRVGTSQLYEILEILDERLIDKLDDALNAEGAQREALHAEAREIIDEYLDFVNTDALMQDIDDNGFIDVKIRSTLDQQLQRMAKELGASFARS